MFLLIYFNDILINFFLIKFEIKNYNKTPLFVALEHNNSEIVKSLLQRPETDVNECSISNEILLI